MATAAFANGNFLRPRCQRDDFRMDQRVMEHDIGALKQARRAQRQQIRRARAGANEIDRALRCLHLGDDRRCGGAAAEQGLRALDRGLIGLAEIIECGEGRLRVLTCL